MVEATDELRERLAEVLWASEYPAKPGSVRAAAHLAWVRKTTTELLSLVAAVVAEARTEGAIAELEAAADLILAPSEHLRDSATCRDIAYDLHERAAALRGVGNQKVGVTVDDLALDEMDGNQNAEPGWSANRLEEVLRDGLPDQNAEPETGPAEWGIAWSADHIDTATSWGADEAGARHRVSKYRDYVLVKRLYGQGDDAWLPADQKGTEQ